MLKRTLDVVLGSVGLLAAAPVLALAAIAIRLDSPGPVLFRQTRVGRDRSTFEILKLRTMVIRETVDQDSEAVLTHATDRRVTRVGRFLRTWSLDELPQLVNVLRGEMSLVGPRPILPEQLAVLPENRAVRFDVRPGITGLAQVAGRRGLDWLDQLDHDVEYARTAGVLRDLGILARTVRVVLSGAGVYGEPSGNWRAYRDSGVPPVRAAPRAEGEG